MPDIKTNFFRHEPRDPGRISDILRRVQAVWEKTPQLRLGQLLGNTCQGSETAVKLYYLEDEELLKRLEAMYKDADKDV